MRHHHPTDEVPDPPECNGHGCLTRHSGLHHDKINGPHYWCVPCPGCPRCQPRKG